MSGLTGPYQGSIKDVAEDLRPLAAGAKVFENGLAMCHTATENIGYYGPADGTKHGKIVGRFTGNYDNTAGADGAVLANIDFQKVRYLMLFDNDTGGTPVTVAKRESPAFALDDHTITGATTTVTAGVIYDVTTEGVWVEVWP